VSLATAVGIPSFVIIQWLAPIISEFPELLSTFYFARQEVKAPVALMNIASSNINQWTLLVAMLPIVLSLGNGSITGLTFDPEQKTELLLTIAQSVTALTFLLNMQFAWWEASLMFVLFAAQFLTPELAGEQLKDWIAYAFLGWSAAEVFGLARKKRVPEAFRRFLSVWRTHVRS
jgi:cation:H+ antiporter